MHFFVNLFEGKNSVTKCIYDECQWLDAAHANRTVRLLHWETRTGDPTGFALRIARTFTIPKSLISLQIRHD